MTLRPALLRLCWPLLGLLLAPADAAARHRGRHSGWTGLAVFASIVVLAVLSKVLPDSVKSHPRTIPIGTGVVLGALFCPIAARIAVDTGFVPVGGEPVAAALAYAVILIVAAAYGLLKARKS